MSDPRDMDVVGLVIHVFNELQIAYAIGGSLASSTYGKVRFTQDADITVEPFERQADRFVERVKDRFYISKEAMVQAIRQRGSFNLIYFDSAFKVDVFVRRDTEFERQVLLRRRRIVLRGPTDQTVSFVSPEDIILLKLRWYRDGGEVSDRQWDDVLGVLMVQAGGLDQEYLQRWAGVLGLTDLIQKALAEYQR